MNGSRGQTVDPVSGPFKTPVALHSLYAPESQEPFQTLPQPADGNTLTVRFIGIYEYLALAIPKYSVYESDVNARWV